jgi:hypothetical protein
MNDTLKGYIAECAERFYTQTLNADGSTKTDLPDFEDFAYNAYESLSGNMHAELNWLDFKLELDTQISEIEIAKASTRRNPRQDGIESILATHSR